MPATKMRFDTRYRELFLVTKRRLDTANNDFWIMQATKMRLDGELFLLTKLRLDTANNDFWSASYQHGFVIYIYIYIRKGIFLCKFL